MARSGGGSPCAALFTASEVFVNARGQPLSRWGVTHILKSHGTIARGTCAALAGQTVVADVLRHTCAMIVLSGHADIRKVSLWLGHSQLTTTEMYVRADPSEKLEAMRPSCRQASGRGRSTDGLVGSRGSRHPGHGEPKRA